MRVEKVISATGGSNARARPRSAGIKVDRVGLAVEKLHDLFSKEGLVEPMQLPPERDLAEQLGISRRILRRALDRLEASASIWRQHGKGTFIGARPVAETKSIDLRDSASNPMEVMEARLELESHLASLAAVRATAAEVKHIEWCLERSQAATDLETFELWDRTLHRAIAEAAHNALLLTLYDIVNVARDQSFWGKLQHHAVERLGFDLIWRQHKAFVNAIVSRDPVEARRCTHAHIAAVRASMFEVELGIAGDEVSTPTGPVKNRPAPAAAVKRKKVQSQKR